MTTWAALNDIPQWASIANIFRSAVKEATSLGQCTYEVARSQKQRGSTLVPAESDLGDALLLSISLIFLLGSNILFKDIVRIMAKTVSSIGKGKAKKFAEAAWELTYYSFSLTILSLTMIPEPWIWSSYLVWEGINATRIPCEIKLLYFVEVAFYLSSLAILLVANRRKKDFVQMAFHHLCTCLLLVFSYAFGYTRIGVIVMALHNVSDPPLHIAKIFNYLGWKPLPDIIFALFVITFIVSRLIIYPAVVLQIYIIGPNYHQDRDKTAIEWLLTILLTLLIPIHVFWTYLIFRMISRLLFQKETIGEQGDIRSDSDDDD